MWSFRSKPPKSGETPRLHTHGLNDPAATLLLSKYLPFSYIIRVVTIDAKAHADALVRTTQYLSLALLRSSGWSDEVWAVHRLVTNPNDHRMVGKTFEENDFIVRQNRLLMGQLLWFLVPRVLRRLVPRMACTSWFHGLLCAFLPHQLQEKALSWHPFWRMEVYTLYVRSKKTGETYFYGTFIEVAPTPRKMPMRSRLGLERVWRKHGLHDAFLGYLYDDSVPAVLASEHTVVRAQARQYGRLGALCAFPVFLALAFLATRKRGREAARRRAVS